MNKLFLSIKVPAISGTYDFCVPQDLKIKDGLILIFQLLGQDFGGIAKNLDKAQLMLPQNQLVLSKEHKFSDYPLQNEDVLVLI